jgi:PAS domain S-box-containing protein
VTSPLHPRRRLIWLALPAAVFVVAAVHVAGDDTVYESRALLTAFNTLFLGSASLLTAVVAWASIRGGRQRGVTSVGCGALTLGLVSILAGPLIPNVNTALTIFNLGLLGAGLCFAFGALRALRVDEVVDDARTSPWLPALAYPATVGVVVLLTLAAMREVTPAFWLPGQGSTMVRSVVLTLAVAVFLLAAALFLVGYRRSRLPFAEWFAAAFALLAVGIAGVLTSAPGTLPNWASRAAQWTAAVYLLAGIASAASTHGPFTLPLREALSEARQRLRLVKESAGMGLFEWDLALGTLHWDAVLRTQFGVDAAEPVDPDRFLALVHPEDRDIARRAMEEVVRPEGSGAFEVEFRIVRKADGETRWLLNRGDVVFEAARPTRVVGVVLDITERKRVEEELRQALHTTQLLLDAARAVGDRTALPELLDRLAHVMLQASAHERVTIGVLDTPSTVTLIAGAGRERVAAGGVHALHEVSASLRQVLTEGRTMIVDYDELAEMDKVLSSHYGAHLALLVPLVYAGRIIGHVAIDSPHGRAPFADQEIALVEAIASQAAAAIEGARSYEAQGRQALRLGVLKEIADVASSALDLDELGQGLAEAVTRLLGASHSLIVVRDETHRALQRVGASGYSADELAELMTPLPPDSELARAFTSGEGRYVVSPEAEGPSANSREGARTLGIKAYAALPLSMKGRALGVLGLGWQEPRDFDAEEVSFLESVAAEMAVGLENARLYEAERQVARTLQEHFVHPLPQVPGLDSAVVTQAAYDPELVGGDFHDVHELPDGDVIVLVGDVEGKGIEAAGLTETVRSAVRSLAFVAPSPRYVLNTVNRLLLSERTEQYVTALVCVLDPASGRVQLASAGHPPPLLISSEGARYIEPPYGPPLGAFPADYDAFAFELPAGGSLVFYTDGLTEARRGDELFGYERLLEAVRPLANVAPGEVVRRLREAALGFAVTVKDDLEILALRRAPLADDLEHPKSLTLTVPMAPDSVADIRGMVRDFFRAEGLDEDLIEDLVLCVDEGCSNAIRHSGSDQPMQVRLRLEEEVVEIVMADEGHGFDPDTLTWDLPDEKSSSGRGLFLMGELVDEMEVSTGSGTAVRLRKRVDPGDEDETSQSPAGRPTS